MNRFKPSANSKTGDFTYDGLFDFVDILSEFGEELGGPSFAVHLYLVSADAGRWSDDRHLTRWPFGRLRTGRRRGRRRCGGRHAGRHAWTGEHISVSYRSAGSLLVVHTVQTQRQDTEPRPAGSAPTAPVQQLRVPTDTELISRTFVRLRATVGVSAGAGCGGR